MVKPELCDQDPTVEIQYMTGGKIIDMFHKIIAHRCEVCLGIQARFSVIEKCRIRFINANMSFTWM